MSLDEKEFQVHEITKDNATIYYCGECRERMFLDTAKLQSSAVCHYRDCSFCGKARVVNVLTPEPAFIPVYLNEDGTPRETYQEREGV